MFDGHVIRQTDRWRKVVLNTARGQGATIEWLLKPTVNTPRSKCCDILLTEVLLRLLLID